MDIIIGNREKWSCCWAKASDRGEKKTKKKVKLRKVFVSSAWLSIVGFIGYLG